MIAWEKEFDNSKRHCVYGDYKDEYVPAKEVAHIVANPRDHGIVEWLRFVRKFNRLVPHTFAEPRFETENKKYHIEVYPNVGEPLFRIFIPRGKGLTRIECYDATFAPLCMDIASIVERDYSKAGTQGFSYTGQEVCA